MIIELILKYHDEDDLMDGHAYCNNKFLISINEKTVESIIFHLIYSIIRDIAKVAIHE